MGKIIHTIQDLQNNNYILVDIDYLVKELNTDYNQDFGCYFVLIDNGEYISIYGCESNIPYLNKLVYKVL